MAVTEPRQEIVRDFEFPFTLERSDGDGRTLEGYAAVFNTPTPISDQRGDYIETIAPGAFKNSINRRMPALMFNHGKSRPIGDIPIGKVEVIREDPRGLYVKARLVDNPTVNILRDAIRDGAIPGMSFFAKIVRDSWSAQGKQRFCTLKELALSELGPVTSPAYQSTSVAVRSMLNDVATTYPELLRVEWLGRDDDAEITTWDQSPADVIADMIGDRWGLGEQNATVHLVDVFDDHAIFTVYPAGHTKYPGLWQVNFTKNADGSVTVADPSRPPLAGYDYGTQPNTQANDEPMKPTSGAPETDAVMVPNRVASADIEGDIERAYSADDRKRMAASGEAMPDGSYPIGNKADLQNAIHAVGRGSGSHDAIRRHIIKRAKALGASDMIPPDWAGMKAASTDFSTSEDADSVTSEDAAVRASEPMTKTQRMKQIALRRRGINV